jgi:hypothetical protein
MPITTCFVDIDDVNEFTWLTPLQAAVEARIGKPDTDTIWIMDTQVCVDTPLDNHLICRPATTEVSAWQCVYAKSSANSIASDTWLT